VLHIRLGAERLGNGRLKTLLWILALQALTQCIGPLAPLLFVSAITANVC
jgi:hypothetical protein